MELTDLTPANLSELIELIDKKKILADRIDRIDAEMISIIKGQTAPKTSPKSRTAPAIKVAPKKSAKAPATDKPVRAKRGALKEGILVALETAGPDGVTVSDLASRLSVEPANVHVWFSTTGRKIDGLHKVAPGRYALGTAAVAATILEPVSVVADEPPAPAPIAPPEELSPAPVFTPVFEPEAPAPLATESPIEETFDAPTTVEPIAEDAPAPRDEDYLMLSPD